MAKKILLVAGLSHSQKNLSDMLAKGAEQNITQLYGSCSFPLGLLSIQSYVRAHVPDVQTQLIDCNAQFMQDITTGNLPEQLAFYAQHFEQALMRCVKPELERFCPDIVAISALFDNTIPALVALAQEIKRIAPHVLIIAGGHPVSNLYQTVFERADGALDAISYGEGEIPFAELLCAQDIHAHLADSPYFATKENYAAKQLLQVQVQELDDIPPHDYDAYLRQYGKQALCYHNNILDSGHSFNKQAVIMTSRGCPYNCIFCASSQVHGKKMRKHSVERVKQEIDFWVERYQVDTIGLIDDHLLFDVDRAIEICDYLGEKGVDIRFPNGLAIAPITPDLVECMQRNRVQEVQLALESGCERVLHEIIKKPLSLTRATEVLDYFSKTNIFVRLFLVVGFPEETGEDIAQTLAFLRTARFGWCSISNPTPISGSRLLKDSLEKGYLQAYDYEQMNFFSPVFQKHTNGYGDLKYTMNLDINFVHNPYMYAEQYGKAKQRFEAVLHNYPRHAFAHYYLAACNRRLSLPNGGHSAEFERLVDEDEFWHGYAQYFGLIEPSGNCLHGDKKE